MARVSPSLLGFISPRDEMYLGGSSWKLSKINQREAESSDGTQPHRLTHTQSQLFRRLKKEVKVFLAHKMSSRQAWAT